MSALYADDSGGPPPDPVFMKAQFDYVEYPKILARARLLDRVRAERSTHKGPVLYDANMFGVLRTLGQL